MRFVLTVGLLVIAILTQSFADEHKHDGEDSPCAEPKFVLPEDRAACLATIPRWYHNHSSGKCEELDYDGCNKNANNFETKEECEKTCDAWHEAHKDHDHGHAHHGHGHTHHQH